MAPQDSSWPQSPASSSPGAHCPALFTLSLPYSLQPLGLSFPSWWPPMLFPAPLHCPSDFSLRVSSPRKLSLILPLPGFFFSWDGIWLHLANVCVWENVPGFNSEAGAGDPCVDGTHPGHASGHSFIFPPVLGGSVAPSSQLRHTQGSPCLLEESNSVKGVRPWGTLGDPGAGSGGLSLALSPSALPAGAAH